MYTFRIKEGSPFEELIDEILSADGIITRKRLVEDGDYGWRPVISAFELAESSDNFVISRSGASYTEVVPHQTVVHQADKVEGAVAPLRQEREGPMVMWPDTPIVTDGFDFFRKPTFYDRMKAMVAAGKHISLAGPPGIGKSTAVEELAAEMGKPLVSISCDSGLRRRDLTGSPELVNGHTQFFVAEYVAAAVGGWWAKIDEVNAAEPDALMYINSQLAPPFKVNFRGKSYPVHKDFRLFVTYNPGLIGTKPLPPAFKDRFFPIKLQFPGESQLRKMLEANGMPPRFDSLEEAPETPLVDNAWTQAVVRFGLAAWEQHQKGRMRYQITPRRLMDTNTLVMQSGENVFDALEQAVIAAVDNVAEVRVLKETLKQVKQEFEFGRL